MKAVLVLDMPSRCFGCKLHRVIYGENENEFMVFCCPLRRPVNDLDERPTWCPLRPLPERKEMPKNYANRDYTKGIVDGWNRCWDEVTGVIWD